MMRVGISPGDVESVTDHRARWPAQVLAESGEIQVTELNDTIRADVVGDRIMKIRNPPDVDVIVFTRLMAGRIVDCIPLLQKHGIAVVMDLDDDFRNTPANMSTRFKIDPTRNRNYNWRHLARGIQLADHFTCSTPNLLSYAAHDRATVIRNGVPEAYLDIEPEAPRDGKTIGWSGAIDSHPGDLDITRGGVGRAVEQVQADFLVIGEPRGVKRALDLPHEPQGTGIVSHDRFPHKVAGIDLGIAPLVDNAYNRSKSWLKPLQYMALGVPWVASPSSEYRRLFEQTLVSDCKGIGALANPRAREWRREVLRALQRPEDELQGLREASRDLVWKRFTIESQADRWLTVWEEAIKCRRSSVAPAAK